jgi:hypothetical protein
MEVQIGLKSLSGLCQPLGELEEYQQVQPDRFMTVLTHAARRMEVPMI